MSANGDFFRACMIKKFGMVELGQCHCRNFDVIRHRIATKMRCFLHRERCRPRPFARTRNAKPEFKKMRLALRTSGGPEGAADRPRCRT